LLASNIKYVNLLKVAVVLIVILILIVLTYPEVKLLKLIKVHVSILGSGGKRCPSLNFIMIIPSLVGMFALQIVI